MDIALSVAAFLLSIVGIVGCIVPALPGVVLSYAGLLCAYFTSYASMSPAAIWPLPWRSASPTISCRRG